MKSYQYTPLSSWLGNADVLYLDARVLWLQISGMGGGLILMWLAIEQLMKTVVFQERLKNGDSKKSNMDEVLIELTSWGKKIGHSFKANRAALYKSHPEIFTAEEEIILQSVYDHFEARYVDNQSRSIEIKALKVLDEVYFRLRDLMSEDIPMSHMDMIDSHRHSQIYRMADYTKFAFIDNPHFHGRANYRT